VEIFFRSEIIIKLVHNIYTEDLDEEEEEMEKKQEEI
jgi:hypothetical protein